MRRPSGHPGPARCHGSRRAGGGLDLMFYAAWTMACLLASRTRAFLGLRAIFFERRRVPCGPRSARTSTSAIIVENRSWIPKLWLEIEDQGQHPEHTAQLRRRRSGRTGDSSAGPHAVPTARRLPAWAGLRRERRPVRAVPPATPDRRRQHAGGVPGGAAAGRRSGASTAS